MVGLMDFWLDYDGAGAKRFDVVEELWHGLGENAEVGKDWFVLLFRAKTVCFRNWLVFWLPFFKVQTRKNRKKTR
jgi:hypothetical protein